MKNKPAKETPSSPGVTSPFPSTPAQKAAPSLIVVGGLDWRFADPFADALAGFNFSGLAASPLARNLIAQLGAKQGIGEADMKKIFDGLSGVDQVAVSIHDNKVVVMLSGSVADLTLPASEAGWKALPVHASAMLVGTADAVDQAAQRIAMRVPLSELARSAEERQSSSEFWASGSARIIGPQALNAGVKRFWLTVSVRDRLTSDLAFEFNGPPSEQTLKMFPMPSATLEGNVLHARMSMEADEVQKKFGEIVASPVGEKLAALVVAAKSLPVRDTTVPKQTKPVIYGLDSGPKVVGQNPN